MAHVALECRLSSDQPSVSTGTASVPDIAALIVRNEANKL